jgi:exodeoxyribonuclease-3
MRIVAWNCNMALDRKVEVLLDLAPDVAIVCECAEPERLRLRSRSSWMQGDPVWIGRNPHKGLAVFAFNGYAVRLAESYHPALRYVAPIHVGGPTECNLLAVWAQNASAERPAVVAGDLNSNTIWDKPGWRINHSTKVRILEESFGLVSAYHAVRGEPHGAESEPTLYWRDRTKDGPTYHIDYIFVPSLWIGKVRELSIGTFETWCGSGLSDHVPVVVDVDV